MTRAISQEERKVRIEMKKKTLSRKKLKGRRTRREAFVKWLSKRYFFKDGPSMAEAFTAGWNASKKHFGKSQKPL